MNKTFDRRNESPHGESGAAKIPSALIDELKNNITNLPELASHHIVLGKYNGKKTKPLSEPTKTYRKYLHNSIPRSSTYSNEECEDLRREITSHIIEELHLPDGSFPTIQFFKDAEKAKGEMQKLQQANAELVQHNGLVFVEDKLYHFFKQDLNVRRRPSDTSRITKKRPSGTGRKRARPNEDEDEGEDEDEDIVETLLDSLQIDSSMAFTEDYQVGVSIGSDHPVSPYDSDPDLPVLPTATQGPNDSSQNTEAPTLFEFQEDHDTLEQQIEAFFSNWIGQGDEGTKLRLSNQFQQRSKDCTIRMLNRMVKSYHDYPHSCLKGEPHSWDSIGCVCSPQAHNDLSLFNPPNISFQPMQDDDDPPHVTRSVPSFSTFSDPLVPHIGKGMDDSRLPTEVSVSSADEGTTTDEQAEENDGDWRLDLLKVVAARARPPSPPPVDIESQASPMSPTNETTERGSERTKEEQENRLSGYQSILMASQLSARSVAASQQPTRSLPVTDTLQLEASPGQGGRATAAAATTTTTDLQLVLRCTLETELNWKERCRMRSDPLVHHQNSFSCNGQLNKEMNGLKDKFTWALGFPIGYGLYLFAVELPVFLFYLLFCGVVGVTCCLLFLVSFWEVNFWQPTVPLQCRDWAWKVPIFLVGSLGYILSTPLVLFTLVCTWIGEYSSSRRASSMRL